MRLATAISIIAIMMPSMATSLSIANETITASDSPSVLSKSERFELAARRPKPPEGVQCNGMGTADQNVLRGIITGMEYPSVWYKVPGGILGMMSSCRRVECYGTSAVYLCAESEQQVKMVSSDVAALADVITKQCCKGDGGMAGHEYHMNNPEFGPPFSVWVGYGNCHVDWSTPPSTYLPGAGNNDKFRD